MKSPLQVLLSALMGAAITLTAPGCHDTGCCVILVQEDDDIHDGVEPFPPIAALLEKAPEPVNLGLYLKSSTDLNPGGFPTVDPAARQAAIQLGKALFWDMNAGSDVQTCASCHFHAGADNRTINQIHPGRNTSFQVAGPNGAVTAADFPFHQRHPADLQASAVVRNSDDVLSSMGVFLRDFVDIRIGDALDWTTPRADPSFQVGGVNARRVEPRNTPTVINAAFNYTSFWDGRARNLFNGVNPFGELDRASGVLVQVGGVLQSARERVRIPDASLASQAVGPPMSDFEMSAAGRSFPKLGKKLLAASLRPLGRQRVAPDDSVLGALASAPTGLIELVPGENAYVTLIKRAFQERYWNAPSQHVTFADGVPAVGANAADPLDTDQYTQMEANFSLFFGLAIQLYEATLVSDDTKFDRVQTGRAAFTPEERDGFNTFFGEGNCFECHGGPVFTAHTVAFLRGGLPPQAPGFLPAGAIELMPMSQGSALYDTGIYNTGTTLTSDDLGRGGDSPFINPLTNQPFPLSATRLALLKRQGRLPLDVAQFVPDVASPLTRAAVDGSFKAPGLRNVELTGPYFHNGGMATLQQVVEFYVRGGNFPAANINDFDAEIVELGRLRGRPDLQANLVKFLLTLTDERVRYERAPFDHPQLFVPAGNGLDGGAETFHELPAVGAGGRDQPLKPFLDLDPLRP